MTIPRYMKTPISHPLWVIRINAVWLGRLKTLYFVIKRKENKPGIPQLCLQTKCTADSGINVNKQCCPGWSLSYSSQKLEFVNKDFQFLRQINSLVVKLGTYNNLNYASLLFKPMHKRIGLTICLLSSNTSRYRLDLFTSRQCPGKQISRKLGLFSSNSPRTVSPIQNYQLEKARSL